jgi:hypothetical protein
MLPRDQPTQEALTALADALAKRPAEYRNSNRRPAAQYRDQKDHAMEAARFIISINPHSIDELKDLQGGDVAAVALRPG